MSILTLGQVASNQRSLYQLNDRLRTAVSDATRTADSTSLDADAQDSTSVVAQNVQSRMNSFREAAQGTARNLAQVAFALRSTEQVGEQLANIQNFTKKALREPLDDVALEKLNKAVKAARSGIDAAAQRNQLPESMLSGASEVAAEQILPRLDAQAVLGKDVVLTSESDVEKFLAGLNHAADQVNSLHLDVQKMMGSYEQMAAQFEVSLQNQFAAASVLPQSGDISLLNSLLGNSSRSSSAQGNLLSPQVLNLI